MPNAEASVQLRAAAVALKAAGAPGGMLRREMLKALRAGAQPLTAAVQDAALAQLPKAGGLNAQVAGQRVSVSIRTGPKTAGVRLTTTAPDTAMTDSGYVRHPLFGNRKKWITQAIPEAVGWWSQTLTDRSPDVTPALVAVITEVTAAINQGLL